ncbi:MAG: hypothetical protein ACRD0H_24805 [Actinomycetes bacterium]
MSVRPVVDEDLVCARCGCDPGGRVTEDDCGACSCHDFDVRSRRARRGEDGFAALELAFGLVILVLVAIVTITLSTWPERATTGRKVARVAAQAAAEQTSWDDAQAAGASAADEAATNYGLRPGDFTVNFAGSIERDGSVTATVSIRMPAIAVPGINAGEWTWTTSNTQAAGAYRSLP